MTRVAGVAAFWIACAVVYATHLRVYHLVRSEPTTFATQLAEAMAHCLVWALLTPIAMRAARRVPLRPQIRVRAVLVHVVIGVAVALTHVTLRAATELPLHDEWTAAFYAERFGRLFARTFSANVLIYGLIVAVVTAIESLVARRSADARREAELANARLAALQSRLQPHFLFNGLNSIAALIRDDPRRAEEMITNLSELLRSAVRRDGRTQIPLEEEVELIEQYVQIEKLRFEDRLHVTVDVPANTRAAMVPPLLLQPLVENAIRHGMKRRHPLHVAVTAAITDDELRLNVVDDGEGMRVDASEGFGIASARDRLRQLHGDRFTFAIEPSLAGGLDVHIAIPLQEAS